MLTSYKSFLRVICLTCGVAQSNVPATAIDHGDLSSNEGAHVFASSSTRLHVNARPVTFQT